MSDHPPIPGYELLRLVGLNDHLVYLARQSSSDRLVQLNVVHSSGDVGRRVADRLRQQAVLLGTLDHPGILRPVEVGDTQDYGFFSALEYAEGGRLADQTCCGPLSASEAVSLARAVASALQYAREQGVVAIDLTPGRVLLTEHGVPKLADFEPLGACHPAEPWVVATLSYAAPEEISDAEGVELSPATDVYRIGAVLYEMLTGQPPFERSEDSIGMLRPVAEQSPAPVRQRNGAVSTDLEAICMKCLEKSPTLRYGQPGCLVTIFDQFLAQ